MAACVQSLFAESVIHSESPDLEAAGGDEAVVVVFQSGACRAYSTVLVLVVVAVGAVEQRLQLLMLTYWNLETDQNLPLLCSQQQAKEEGELELGGQRGP